MSASTASLGIVLGSICKMAKSNSLSMKTCFAETGFLFLKFTRFIAGENPDT